MLPRTARRKFETTLLASRQALPRPARLYSTPTKKTSAPSTATVTHAPTPDFPFFPQSSPQHSVFSNFEQDLTSFLDRSPPITIIPTPTPGTSDSPNPWYTDSRSLDMSGIIDACLHNLYDVPRAQDVFSRLRTKVGSNLLNSSLYNAFLEAYVGIAQKDEMQREYWIREAWKLYEVLELGTEEVHPNARTYSTMLFLWHQYVLVANWMICLNFFSDRIKTRALHTEEPMEGPSPGQLLSKIVERDIPVMSVVSNPVLESPDVMAEIAKALSSEAVNLGFKNILEQLGQSPEVTVPDAFSDVPEVLPVLKKVVRTTFLSIHSSQIPWAYFRKNRQTQSQEKWNTLCPLISTL